jgi:nucleoside phosphorylase
VTSDKTPSAVANTVVNPMEGPIVSAMVKPVVLVVAGLAFEADIARRCAGVDVLFGVGQAALSERVERAAARAAGIVSFGTAGALSPQLRPGDWLLATSVLEYETGAASSPAASLSSSPPRLLRHATDSAWFDRLTHALPAAHHVDLFAAANPVAQARDKAALFAQHGTAAVDMESGHLARLAARHGLPFMACRVVIDRADHTLPAAALAGMSSDGQTSILPVLRSLANAPGQLPSLLRLAADAWQARRALSAMGQQLPPGFGLKE